MSRVHLSRVVRTCNTSQEPNVTIPSASDTFSGMSFLPGRRLGVGLGADQPARKRSICSDGGPTVASDHRQVRGVTRLVRKTTGSDSRTSRRL